METAMSPATRVLPGVLGTIAAPMSTTAPIHVICGMIGQVAGTGSQCISNPSAAAERTR